jgi:branched-chain amino acid transport system ATP-binding protein
MPTSARNRIERLLNIVDIHVSYDGVEVLKGVSMSVEQGSIVTIIGPNGAGKSTALKTICGTLRPASGEIWYQESRIDGLSTEDVVGLRIGHVPEGRRIFPHLTVLENLRMGAYLIKDKRLVESSLKTVRRFFPILDERRGQAGGSLSGGEQQMLAIARALMGSPLLILMDEPTLGLSPLICKHLSTIIADLNTKEHKTILLVEQNARMALGLSDQAYVLERGEIVLEGRCDELKRNEKVARAYLGQLE